MTPCQTQQASTEYAYVRFQGKTELAHRVAYVGAHGLTLADIVGQVVRHRCKEFGGRALAARFGVHESTVSDIMLGYTWGHV